MDLKEYQKKLESDPAVIKAKVDLKPYLDLADQVLRMRIERGWSQEELARRVGTRQSNISKLESGLANPTLKFLIKVGEAFGTPLNIHFEKQKEPGCAAVFPVVLEESSK